MLNQVQFFVQIMQYILQRMKDNNPLAVLYTYSINKYNFLDRTLRVMLSVSRRTSRDNFTVIESYIWFVLCDFPLNSSANGEAV